MPLTRRAFFGLMAAAPAAVAAVRVMDFSTQIPGFDLPTAEDGDEVHIVCETAVEGRAYTAQQIVKNVHRRACRYLGGARSVRMVPGDDRRLGDVIGGMVLNTPLFALVHDVRIGQATAPGHAYAIDLDFQDGLAREFAARIKDHDVRLCGRLPEPHGLMDCAFAQNNRFSLRLATIYDIQRNWTVMRFDMLGAGRTT